MKTRSRNRLYVLACLSALTIAFMTALQAQTTPTAPVTPINPTGSPSDSKSGDSSVAQQRDGSVSTATTPASAPDTTSSKDTTTPLDSNPSTAPTDSANMSATKDPTLATSPEQAGQKTASSGHFSDRHFLVKAAEGGMTEVELGQIAQQKASSQDVKQFGARMVDDHSKADTELKGIAQQQGVSIPTKLDARHQAAVDKLSKLSGADFDRAYVNDMVKDHQADEAEFQKASTSAQDPQVKDFASKTLPVIQSHLADIQSIQSKLK
jgi:putative membrane protein